MASGGMDAPASKVHNHITEHGWHKAIANDQLVQCPYTATAMDRASTQTLCVSDH